MHLDRRAFLSSSSGAVAGLGILGLGSCSTEAPKPASGSGEARRGATTSRPTANPSSQLFQISLAEWSFHRALGRGGKKTMDNLDFAQSAASMGFDGIEYVNQFFKDKAKDKAYLDQLNKAAADAGIHQVLIMCDGEGRLGDPDAGRRTRAVENHYKWVDAAKHLGCHCIRVNAASKGPAEEQMKLAADGLRRLTEFAAAQDLSVLVENHGGLSSNGAWLAAVMKQVDHRRCGTLPDFGNFNLGKGKKYDRYQGVEELMPFAQAVSAKSHDFDAEGNEIHTDFARMMKIVLKAGYRGFVGVEYEGRKLGEKDGILKTKSLLERVRKQAIEEKWI